MPQPSQLVRNAYYTARIWLPIAWGALKRRLPRLDGTQAAERVATAVGSWRFVVIQNVLIAVWMLWNAASGHGFDPFPFILLNLCMSWQAANATPILQMTGNAAATRDRAQAARIEQQGQRIEQLERVLDEHVNTTAKEHAAELRANTMLTEEIHRMLTAQQQQTTEE